MASLHDTETKDPSKKDICVLSSNFLSLYNRGGVKSIDLNNVAAQLGVRTQLILVIANILESVGVLTKKAEYKYTWNGFNAIPHVLEELRKQASNENSKFSQYCSFGTVVNENDYRGPSNSNNSNTDRHTKSSGSSKSDNNRKLGHLTQNFIKLVISSKYADFISLKTAAKALSGDIKGSKAMRKGSKATRRTLWRLYDIANVFVSMNLLEKRPHPDPESRKPTYRWLGWNPKTKTQTLDTNNSKRRSFGTDITNHDDSKRHRIDSLSDWSSKEVSVAMHMNLDSVKVECDENMTVPPQRNLNEFVFGPFTPATAHKVGTSSNKKFKQAQDRENLADTYCPQCCKKGSSSGGTPRA